MLPKIDLNVGLFLLLNWKRIVLPMPGEESEEWTQHGWIYFHHARAGHILNKAAVLCRSVYGHDSQAHENHGSLSQQDGTTTKFVFLPKQNRGKQEKTGKAKEIVPLALFQSSSGSILNSTLRGVISTHSNMFWARWCVVSKQTFVRPTQKDSK